MEIERTIPRKRILGEQVSLLAAQRRGVRLHLNDFGVISEDILVGQGVPELLIEPLLARHNTKINYGKFDQSPISDEERLQRVDNWNRVLLIISDITQIPDDLRGDLNIPLQ